MFSSEDARELFQSFPPSAVPSPSLILASRGQDLITRDRLRTDYEGHLAQGKLKRLPVADLARELDVDVADMLRLVRSLNPPAVLSANGNDIIPEQEIDAIAKQLRSSLRFGVVSKRDYESQTGIAFESLKSILGQTASELISYDDHICTYTYDKEVASQALEIVARAINDTSNIDIHTKDLEELPGPPPRWLFLRHLERHIESENYSDKVSIREKPDCIRVQSKNMRMGKVKEWSEPLLSGEIAYVDLQYFMKDNVTHESIEDVLSDFRGLPEVDIVDHFAISDAWILNFVNKRLQALHNEQDGVLDISYHLNEELQSTGKGCSKLPESLYGHLDRKAEEHLIDALSQNNDHDYHRFGTIILTKEQYRVEQDKLVTQAQEAATFQWQQLNDSADHEIKLTITTISTATPHKASVHEAILKEKSIQKACDEHFWTSIASLEAENESSFAKFWSDRVDSRINMYAEGLRSITDTKLSDQLSDLLTTYLQNDLIPDSLVKARSQSLVMSRKTKKNLSKLESTLSITKPELPALTCTLEKFAKRQSIHAPPQSLTDAKQSTLSDMLRRMAKPSSSDPILFLYLVVILHAKHYPGIVYATGKYAPKLMKMLKGKVSDKDMEKLEAWKEGAKTGTLGEEGRAGMRGMAMAEIGRTEGN
ncbi:hypothetical protein BDU57DRAFT_456181 [Ampelomyces quisqualis]|uniref:Uncharacterized protein n=1 Tax=Ampelomyces quisqualis TaxID=50730 RepID=A0A6A5QF78_AMPQU|nr:hypothetical protein BDU57DRAFT_456181 [Ampelomyces quisqualis]